MQRATFLRSAAVIAWAAFSAPLAAEPLPLAYDHMHLAAPDREEAMQWYIEHLDAKMHPNGDRVTIGDVMLVWIERESSERSEGSAVDHFGVSFADLPAKMREWEAAGVKVLAPIRDDIPNFFKFAFIEDPWGTKIEVVEDRALLGFHHVHVAVPNPQATLAWYAEHLGGVPAKLYDRIDGLRFGDVWFLARQAESARPSRGTAIDHLGWLVQDAETFVAELEAKGVEVVLSPRRLPASIASLIDDGNGIVIDLVQRTGLD